MCIFISFFVILLLQLRFDSLLPQSMSNPGGTTSIVAHTAGGVATAAEMPVSFPPWDAPPQITYGWFVDVPPPRGPYFWPLQPDGYKLRMQSLPHSEKAEEKDASSLTGGCGSSLFNSAPQVCWGWYCAAPPPQPPFLWPSIPEGYVLQRIDEVDITVGPPLQTTTPTSAVVSQLPQRSPSSVTANPLAGSSTLPAPHAIATQPLPPPGAMPPLPMPIMHTPSMQFPPFIPPQFSPPPLPTPTTTPPAAAAAATAAPHTAEPMEVDAPSGKTKKASTRSKK